MNHHGNITAGLDLGAKYSHLCLLDTQSGEIIEQSRLRSTIETFENRFASMPAMQITVEAGTPWVSRLLKRCGHQVNVTNARQLRLSYHNKHKSDWLDAEN